MSARPCADLTHGLCCNSIQLVNDFYSEPLVYYPRWLTAVLRSACEAHPIVVLTGARQVGKSTLLRRAAPFSGWRYRTMDDFDTLRQTRDNPQSL